MCIFFTLSLICKPPLPSPHISILSLLSEIAAFFFSPTGESIYMYLWGKYSFLFGVIVFRKFCFPIMYLLLNSLSDLLSLPPHNSVPRHFTNSNIVSHLILSLGVQSAKCQLIMFASFLNQPCSSLVQISHLPRLINFVLFYIPSLKWKALYDRKHNEQPIIRFV